MSVIILLLIASLSVALLFLGLFIRAARHRQFDDDYAPPMRILFDDNPAPEEAPDRLRPSADPISDPKSTIQ